MKKNKKIIIIVIVVAIIFATLVTTMLIITNKKKSQKEIIAKSKNIININGLEFKDLNNNGKLDNYEDWRLTSNQRAKDLVNQMTIEEKAGMMVINTQYTAVGQNDKSLTSMNGILNEGQASNDTKIYLNYTGNTQTIRDLNIRHLIIRETINAESLAKWNNALNELAESSRLGIPVEITSNSRNHMTVLLANQKSSTNTIYPYTLGIAAAAMGEEKYEGKSDIVKNFANVVRTEFKLSGIRKGYMYNADLVTDPRWFRNSETFGENVDFVSKTMETLVSVMQGEKSLNSEGIALTLKHFPGSGARKNGYDSHFETGRYTPYYTQNSLENYHLKPFQVAINAGLSSIMPYYSQPDPNSASQEYNEQKIDMTGSSYTYNDEFLIKLLKENMKFEGYVNTDSGVVDYISWGEEDKTNIEKVAKAINSGVDLISDTNHTEWIIQAVEQGLVTEDRINESVEKVLKEMFDLGLFENPYVNQEESKTTVVNDEFMKEAYKVHQKSVVLLKNDNDVLPIKADNGQDKIKIYIKEYGTTQRILLDALASKKYNFEVVKDYNDADYLLTYLSPKTTSDIVYNLNLKDLIGTNYDEWINIGNTIKENGGKRITIVNFPTPLILNGIEQYSDSILGGFNTYTCAILDAIVGEFKPTGVLPFTLPASDEVVAIDENQRCASPNDVPGYDKNKYMNNGLKYEYLDQNNSSYICGYGITYKD